MDMDRDNNSLNTTTGNTRVYENKSGGSNFLAYLIGGLVIAVGLLAFLFYDGGSTGDPTTTGSTTTQSAPANPITGTGAPGTDTTTAPATPTTPPRPAPAPANPQ